MTVMRNTRQPAKQRMPVGARSIVWPVNMKAAGMLVGMINGPGVAIAA